MAVTAHGATFTFSSDRGTLVGGVTNISVEAPTAEVVDMTAASAAEHAVILVPTGTWKGGSITVDFNVTGGASFNVQTFVRGVGEFLFASSGYSVRRQAILTSATTQAAVGDVVKCSAKFVPTDYR